MLNTRANGPKVTRISTLDDLYKIYENIHLATPSQLHKIMDLALSNLIRDRDEDTGFETTNFAIVTIAEVLSTRNPCLRARTQHLIDTWEKIAEIVLESYTEYTGHRRAGKMLKTFVKIMQMLANNGAESLDGLYGSASAQFLYYKYWLMEPPSSRAVGLNLEFMANMARVKPENIDRIIRDGMAKPILDAIIKQIDIIVTTATKVNDDERLLGYLDRAFHILESFLFGAGDDRIVMFVDSKIVGVLIRELRLVLKRFPNSSDGNSLCFPAFIMLATIFRKESYYIKKAIKKGFFEILAILSARLKQLEIESYKDTKAAYAKIRDTLLTTIGRELVFPKMITLISISIAKLSAERRNQLYSSGIGKNWGLFETLVIERHATLRLCRVYERLTPCEMCGKEDLRSKLMLCSACNGAFYCSKTCQVAAWKSMDHKTACKTRKPRDFTLDPSKRREATIVRQLVQQDIGRHFGSACLANFGHVAAFDPSKYAFIVNYTATPAILHILEIDRLHLIPGVEIKDKSDLLEKCSRLKEAKTAQFLTLSMHINPEKIDQTSFGLRVTTIDSRYFLEYLERKTTEGGDNVPRFRLTCELGTEGRQCYAIDDIIDYIIDPNPIPDEDIESFSCKYWGTDVDDVIYGTHKSHGLPPVLECS